jgi:transcriptional antiterminator RfaH
MTCQFANQRQNRANAKKALHRQVASRRVEGLAHSRAHEARARDKPREGRRRDIRERKHRLAASAHGASLHAPRLTQSLVSQMIRWYAAKTKSGQDHLALDNLRRQNFETYYPNITIARYHNGKIRRDSEGLFPGYVLVRFTLEASSWRVINSTRGVYRLLSFNEDGRPSAMPEGEVETLRRKEQSGQLYISEVVRLRRGDRIRLKVGPSVDQIGEVLRTRGERVEFLLRLLGRRVRCIAPQHTLELVNYPRAHAV